MQKELASSTFLLVFKRFYVGSHFHSPMWCSRWGSELCVCVREIEWVGSGEVVFVDPPFYLRRGLGAHTAAVVDFLEVFLLNHVWLKRCGSASIVCNEGLFFLSQLFYLFKKTKRKRAILFELLWLCVFIKAPTVAWCLQPVWEWMLIVRVWAHVNSCYV